MLLDAATRGPSCTQHHAHGSRITSTLQIPFRCSTHHLFFLRPVRTYSTSSSSHSDTFHQTIEKGRHRSIQNHLSKQCQSPVISTPVNETSPITAPPSFTRRHALSSTIIGGLTLSPPAAGPASAAASADSDTSIKSMLQQAMDSIGGRLPNPKTSPSQTPQPEAVTKPSLPPSSRHSRAGINLPLVQQVTLPSGLVLSKVRRSVHFPARIRGFEYCSVPKFS